MIFRSSEILFDMLTCISVLRQSGVRNWRLGGWGAHRLAQYLRRVALAGPAHRTVRFDLAECGAATQNTLIGVAVFVRETNRSGYRTGCSDALGGIGLGHTTNQGCRTDAIMGAVDRLGDTDVDRHRLAQGNNQGAHSTFETVTTPGRRAHLGARALDTDCPLTLGVLSAGRTKGSGAPVCADSK